MDYLLSQLLNGISLGGIYALIALGFAMVYGVLKFLNFAHSEVFTAGTFAAYFSLQTLTSLLPYNHLLALVISMLIAGTLAGLLAVLIEIIAYRPLRGAPPVVVLLSAIGVSIFLQNLGIFFFTPHTRGFPTLDLPVSPREIAIIILLLSFAFLYTVIYKSNIGLRTRAVSDSPDVAALMGIPASRVIMFTFFLGGFFAGIAGVIWGIVYGTVSPQMGFHPGLKAFIIAVAGSIGNLLGTFIIGLTLGVIEALASGYLPSSASAYRDAIVFGLLATFLIFRPNGLLERGDHEKV